MKHLCFLHPRSFKGVGFSRKLLIVPFRWTPALCLSKNSVLVMGDLTQ